MVKKMAHDNNRTPMARELIGRLVRYTYHCRLDSSQFNHDEVVEGLLTVGEAFSRSTLRGFEQYGEGSWLLIDGMRTTLSTNSTMVHIATNGYVDIHGVSNGSFELVPIDERS